MRKLLRGSWAAPSAELSLFSHCGVLWPRPLLFALMKYYSDNTPRWAHTAAKCKMQPETYSNEEQTWIFHKGQY